MLLSGVHQVSGTVKDFNAAAENLRRSAGELQEEVGQFHVAG
jgi:methyl-accepting chemotaxis protein